MIATISIRIVIGSTVYHLDEVGDPHDALFAIQVGNAVGHALLAHQEES